MASTKQYQPGSIIIQENDTGETAYIVKSGRVSVTKESQGESIHICDLEAGSIFGEMSMIDDKPRSATITALEATVVQEIHRDSFFSALQNEQELAVKILRVLFERLRKSNALISQLQLELSKANHASDTPQGDVLYKSNVEVLLEGMNRQAENSLPENPYLINEFPFLIGRKT